VKTAQNRNLALQLWGSIYVLAFLGAVAITFISMAERMALRWHSSQTTTA
jgi:ABC-type nitrate/sulfonate/bicarbonate transport system permease component